MMKTSRMLSCPPEGVSTSCSEDLYSKAMKYGLVELIRDI